MSKQESVVLEMILFKESIFYYLVGLLLLQIIIRN